MQDNSLLSVISYYEKNSSLSQIFHRLTLLEEIDTEAGQNVKLFTHFELGRIMVINDEIQHVEAWAKFYHESIVHIPCAFIKNVKRALILGGGSLFAAQELLKYSSLKELILIDYDREVLDLMQRYYPHAAKVLTDNRLILKHYNILEGIELEGEFDFIVNDAIDFYKHSKEKPIFQQVLSRLNDSGLCSDLIYRHIFELETTQSSITLLSKLTKPIFSLVTVPEYPGILHLLSIWGKNEALVQNNSSVINEEQLTWINNNMQNPCSYYNPRFTAYYLYLPPYLRKLFPTFLK